MTTLFEQALTSSRKNDLIPDHLDLFAGLLGHWDFTWVDGVGTTKERHVPGEWLFSRVLDGTGVQDVFICPARGAHSAQPDGEYGTTLRIYNPRTLKWDIFYGCAGVAVRLEGCREGADIVLTEVTTGAMRYVFSDIRADAFTWTKHLFEEGVGWRRTARLEAVRRG